MIKFTIKTGKGQDASLTLKKQKNATMRKKTRSHRSGWDYFFNLLKINKL